MGAFNMASGRIKYFAYGSNMHPERLSRRVPSSECIDVASLTGYRLCFHKIGRDQSAKCNILHTGDEADCIYGVIYLIDPEEKTFLDEAEGLGHGYDLANMQIATEQAVHDVFCYLANHQYIDDNLLPFDWYHQLVVTAARYHGLPESYISAITAIESQTDDDRERARLHYEILESL